MFGFSWPSIGMFVIALVITFFGFAAAFNRFFAYIKEQNAAKPEQEHPPQPQEKKEARKFEQIKIVLILAILGTGSVSAHQVTGGGSPPPALMLQRMTAGCNDCADKFSGVLIPTTTIVDPVRLKQHSPIDGGMRIPSGIQYDIFVGETLDNRRGYGPITITESVMLGTYELIPPPYEVHRRIMSMCVSHGCTYENFSAITYADGTIARSTVRFEALAPGIDFSIPEGVKYSLIQDQGIFQTGHQAIKLNNVVEGNFTPYAAPKEIADQLMIACPSCLRDELFAVFDDKGNMKPDEAVFNRIILAGRDFALPAGIAYQLTTLHDCNVVLEGEGPFFVLDVIQGHFRLLPPRIPRHLYLPTVLG